MKWTHFSTIASPSLIMRTPRRAALSVVLHDSDRCLFDTYRRPSLAANFSVLSLTGSTASLSLSLCGEVFLLAAQSTAPSIGGGAGPHRSVCALGQSFVQIGVDGTRFVVVCSTLSRWGNRSSPPGLQHHPPSEVSQPARAIAPPIVG